MPNYTFPTQAKIDYLKYQIDQHKEWGSTKLQSAITERFGSALKKNYLLKEAEAYRASKGIEAPRIIQGDYNILRRELRKGEFTQKEVSHFIEQINHNYSSEGRHNFVTSEAVKEAAKSHKNWFDELVKELEDTLKTKDERLDKVKEKINELLRKGQYDPFHLLSENEKADTVFSGVIRIKKLKRDYTEARRERALYKRERVGVKVIKDIKTRYI